MGWRGLAAGRVGERKSERERAVPVLARLLARQYRARGGRDGVRRVGASYTVVSQARINLGCLRYDPCNRRFKPPWSGAARSSWPPREPPSLPHPCWVLALELPVTNPGEGDDRKSASCSSVVGSLDHGESGSAAEGLHAQAAGRG